MSHRELTFLMSKLDIGSTKGHSPDLYLCANAQLVSAKITIIRHFILFIIKNHCQITLEGITVQVSSKSTTEK